MQYSQSGLSLTEQFEGCRLTAYLDSGCVPTIGYGHTNGVMIGNTCTQFQAEQWLMEDIQRSITDVNQLVTVQLNQGEFDALVDFDFNIGRGNLARSTLLVDLNAGNFSAAAAQFQVWDKCDGTVLAGLLRRRLAESAEFTGASDALQA